MGLYDRDYVREGYQGRSSTPVGGLRMWSVNTWIIAICVAVYFLNSILVSRMIIDGEPFLYRPLERWGVFTVNAAPMRV